MCGIAGVVSFNHQPILSPDRWTNFTRPLQYRGPDDKGDWHHQTDRVQLSFFHTRLSIIDLSPSGHQPMVSDDERVLIVFNGEIYNYKSLQEELRREGYQFRSTSDTEVLLIGYRCWGIETLLRKIDGMFAFALFDKDENTAFLVRDRFGKKPLYYFHQGHRLVFSSDIRSFRAIDGLNLSIDLHALGYFFAEFGTPEENSIWTQVKKVRPSTFIRFGVSGSKESAYWKLSYTEDCPLTNGEIAEKTEALLKASVKKRLVSDVNVSALLSGGIDSSLIVAKMAELSAGRVSTYSVGFGEDGFNELPFAKQVAEKFGTHHTELMVEPADFQIVNTLIREFGEPFADASMIPTYLISREVARKEKVVLGGDGGDEFFGGYDSYYFALKYDKVKRLKHGAPLANLASKVLKTYRAGFLNRLLEQAHRPAFTLLHRNFTFDTASLALLFNDPQFYNALNSEHQRVWENCTPHSRHDLINVMAGSLRTRLLNDYLVKVDRASMFASLEMRSPYLDRELAEFVATLRPHQLYFKSQPKYILKRIASKYFNDEFILRRKMGFGIPIGNWFRKELLPVLKSVVLGGQSMVNINYAYVEKLIDQHVRGEADHTDRLWTLYVFHIWANEQ